jgi:hypothetical protein
MPVHYAFREPPRLRGGLRSPAGTGHRATRQRVCAVHVTPFRGTTPARRTASCVYTARKRGRIPRRKRAQLGLRERYIPRDEADKV